MTIVDCTVDCTVDCSYQSKQQTSPIDLSILNIKFSSLLSLDSCLLSLVYYHLSLVTCRLSLVSCLPLVSCLLHITQQPRIYLI